MNFRAAALYQARHVMVKALSRYLEGLGSAGQII